MLGHGVGERDWLGIPLVHLRVWVYDESNIPNISASMRAAVF